MIWTAALLLTATIAATPASRGDSAPADEYFGPFKYSAITVRTKIDELGRSYRERWQDDASLIHDAQMVETSFRVWAQRYPRDRWLAPTALHLAQLYQEIQTPAARNLAMAQYRYVAQTYPRTREGRLARLRLAQGFPALHAESPVSPTPSPYGSPGVSPSPAASASAVPAASPAPPGSPAAKPSPSAVPIPSPTR